MTSIHDFIGGEYMKAADLQGGERTVTIREFKVETLDDAQAGKDRKIVCYFQEAPKGVVLNKCNALTLLELFGTDQLERWNEQAKAAPVRVVLFTEQTQLGPGIRLRKAPDQAPTAAPTAAPPWSPAPAAAPTAPPMPPADPAQMWAFWQWMQAANTRA